MTTNTVFQLRRNAVSGTRPTTSTVAPGELAINTTDGILFSANSTTVFEIGANTTSIAVGNSTVRHTANSTGIVVNGTAVINIDSTSDALRITQIGTGNALVVEDSANPDSTPFAINGSGQVMIGRATAPFGSSLLAVEQISNNTQAPAQDFLKNRVGGAVVSGDGVGQLRFWGFDGTTNEQVAAITALAEGTIGTGDVPGRIVFSTRGAGTASVSERMRIDSSGNVGIGTTTPTQALEVSRSGALNAYVEIDQSAARASSTARSGLLLDKTGVNQFALTIDGSVGANGITYYEAKSTTGQHVFFTDTTEKFRIAANGNVGVGNTAPAYRLRVQGDISLSGGIHANGSFGSAGQSLFSNGTIAYWDTGLTTSSTATLTNKRIDPRVSSASSASSVTPDISSFDMYIYTALATGLTINATTGGAPVDGSKLVFRFKDNGTARALTWTTVGSNAFRAVGVTLPTTTVINKVTYVGCIYNAAESFWDVIAAVTQA